MRHFVFPILMLTAAVLTQPSLARENTRAIELLSDQRLPPSAAPAKGPDDGPAIQVTGGAEPSVTPIVDTPAFKISSHRYIVRGLVKYENVAGDGYLELWSDFGAKGKYFTRSLAPLGKMRKLTGSSDWREFELPFHADPGMRPEKLTLNVVLPGAGTVFVSQPVVAAIDSSGHWWSEQQTGWLGGVMGCLLGGLGAVIGCLASRNTARHLTFGLFVLGMAIGAILLIFGVAALAMHQPWHVYYPLLLGGIIGLAVVGGNFWNLLRRYRADELRRIAAVDA